MGMDFCIVCGKLKREVKALHSFTTLPERRRQWTDNMNIIIYGNNMAARSLRICSEHFEPSCYAHEKSIHLNRNAVPTLKPACWSPSAARSKCVTILNQGSQTENPVSIPTIETSPSISKKTDSESLSSFTQLVEKAPSSANSSSPSLCLFNLLSSAEPVLPQKTGPKKKYLYKIMPSSVFNKLSPRKQKLIDIFKKKHHHLRALKNSYKSSSLTSFLNIKDNSSIKKLFSGLSFSSLNFLISQVRWFKKTPRNWSLDDKIHALRLFQRSHRCYSLLRRFFALPPRSALNSLLRQLSFKPGINCHLFEHLQQVLRNRMDMSSICSLLFAETSIKKHLEYDGFTDNILGLEDHGPKYRSNKPADRVLVFMAKGCIYNWKQPLAFYFNDGPFSPIQLESILCEVLDTCRKYHLDVVVTISELNPNNFKTFENMGATVHCPFIESKNCSIPVMFDPPQLLVSTRNLFKKYPIEFPVHEDNDIKTYVARWQHIQWARDLDNQLLTPLTHLRYLSKITDAHVRPSKKEKKNVQLAAQVFSNTMAAYIFCSLTAKVLSVDCMGTAYFLGHVDILFDSLNGSASEAEPFKDVRCVVTEKSPHWKYWEEVFRDIKQWKFQRDNPSKPPTQIGWLYTIRAFSYVCRHLIGDRQFESVRPKQFNLDALENLFAAVKSDCDSSDSAPTARQFCDSLKIQILNGLTSRLEETNREEDGACVLSDFRSILRVDDKSEENTCESTTKEDSLFGASKIVNEIVEGILSSNMDILSTVCISAFISKRFLTRVACANCLNMLTSDSLLVDDLYFYNRKFAVKENQMNYPSKNFVNTVAKGIILLETVMPRLIREAVEIRQKATEYIYEKLDFKWFTCSVHFYLLKDCVVGVVTRIGVPWYCTRLNRKLKLQNSNLNNKKKTKK